MARNIVIDVHRFIMIAIMALAHAVSFFIGVSYTEFWFSDIYASYSTIRLVSHIAAPGFFLLMGMSLIFFWEKYRKKGYTKKQMQLMLLKKVCILFVLQFTIINSVWFFEGAGVTIETISLYFTGLVGLTSHQYYFGVLWALGMSVLVVMPFIQLKKNILLIGAIISFLIAQTAVFLSQYIGVYALYFLYPIVLPFQTEHILVFYSVFPWVGIVFIGMYLGRLLQQKGNAVYVLFGKIGMISLGVGILLRFLQIGNAPFNVYTNTMSFFTLTKYSPSPVFLLVTMGVNLIILFLLQRCLARYGNVCTKISILGKYALPFYVVHLVVLLCVAVVYIPVLHAGTFIFLVWFGLIFGIYPLMILCIRYYQKH